MSKRLYPFLIAVVIAGQALIYYLILKQEACIKILLWELPLLGAIFFLVTPSVRCRDDEVEYYLSKLAEISRIEEIHNGNYTYSVRTLQKELSKMLNVDIVGTWTFDETRTNLQLLESYHFAGRANFRKSRFERSEIPGLFEVLESGAIVKHPDKLSFINIDATVGPMFNAADSIIGCPYFIEGLPAGFIICGCSKKRTWKPIEVIFIRAIADSLSQAFKSFKRVEQEIEIKRINEHLEEKIAARTSELKIRNDQLTEFAFINSHKIRGPICRLLGLNNILEQTTDCQEISLLRTHISQSIGELDQITREATIILSDSNLQ